MPRPICLSVITLFATLACVGLPAHAGEPPAPLLVEDDLVLLPLSEARLEHLYRGHAAVLETLQRTTEELAELDEQEAEAKQRGRAWRAAERSVLQARRQQAMDALAKILAGEGVDRAALTRAAEFPEGPARVERFAHAQVVALPRLDPARAALLRQVAAAADAVHLTLHHQARRLLGEREDGQVDDALRERIESGFEEQREIVESRFWRIVDYVLDEAEMRRLHVRLPVPFREQEDWVEHALQLPDLTLGQAGRLRSLEAAQASEASADDAAAERLERKLDQPGLENGGLGEAEREQIERELDQVYRRLTDLEVDTRARAAKMLGAERWATLEALPPRVGAEARASGPAEVLDRVMLTAAQIKRLGPLATRYRTLQRLVDGEYEKLERSLAEMGPDSPQMKSREMSEMLLTGKLVREIHALMRPVFVEIMTPAQVVEWLLLPSE